MSLGDSFLEEKISNIRETLHRLTVHYQNDDSPPESPLLKSSYSAADLNDIREHEEFKVENTSMFTEQEDTEKEGTEKEGTEKVGTERRHLLANELLKEELHLQEQRRVIQVQKLNEELVKANSRVITLENTIEELQLSNQKVVTEYEKALHRLKKEIQETSETNFSLQNQLNLTISEVKSMEDTLFEKESELLEENVRLVDQVQRLEALIEVQKETIESLRPRLPLQSIGNTELNRAKRKTSKSCLCKSIVKSMGVKCARDAAKTMRENEKLLNKHKLFWSELKSFVGVHVKAKSFTQERVLQWIKRLADEYVKLKSESKASVTLAHRLQSAFEASSHEAVFESICSTLSENEKLLLTLREIKRCADGVDPLKANAAVIRLLDHLF